MADVYIRRGEARDLDILIQDPDAVPVNVIGWVAKFRLCRNIIAEAPLIDWSSAVGQQPTKFDVGVADPEHVVVKLDDADTSPLAPGWYAWDLLLTDQLGADFAPISGYLYVRDTQFGA